MKQLYLLLSTYFILSCLANAQDLSPAQSRLDSVQHLQEVSVIANRYNEVIPAQRLSGKELESLNSFSVADAIRYFSGVQIKDYGGIGGLKTVDIRSMGTNHMGVFYDGIQLGNAQNGQIDLGKFSLDNIEEISLYNGQKSEIFQSAKDFGSAGTIYLRTRRPQFKDGKKTNLSGIFRTGSFGLYNPSVLWEQKLSENVSSSFNAEYIGATGRYKYHYIRYNSNGSIANDTVATRENGDIKALRIEGGLNGYFAGGKWNWKSYFYDSERGIPGAIVSGKWNNPQRQWDRNFFTQSSFQKEITDRYSLLLNVKYANDYMHYLNKDTIWFTTDGDADPSLAFKTNYINNQFRQQELYVSMANNFRILPNWDIAFSTDYQWNILDADLQDFVNPKRHTLLTALATAFEWHRFKTQASLLGTFIFENVTRIQHGQAENLLPGMQTGTPSNKQEFTPAVFFSYQPFPAKEFNLRAFYKRIFRMPTFNDLYYTDIGNIALNPEYTTQYNIGFQYRKDFNHQTFKSLTLKTDAYYNEVTDKIVAVPKGSGQYRWMMMNLGFVKIHGADLNARLQCVLFDKLHFQANLAYTYQRAQDFTESDDTVDPEANPYGGQIPYIPRHSGSFTAQANYKTWNLNYSFIYVGVRYHNSSNIYKNYEPAWYTHDINAGKEFRVNKTNFRISAEINNLLNQFFEVVYNYPMPGRNYKLTLKLIL